MNNLKDRQYMDYGQYLLKISPNWYFGSVEYRNANVIEKLMMILAAGILLGLVLILSVYEPVTQKKKEQK